MQICFFTIFHKSSFVNLKSRSRDLHPCSLLPITAYSRRQSYLQHFLLSSDEVIKTLPVQFCRVAFAWFLWRCRTY